MRARPAPEMRERAFANERLEAFYSEYLDPPLLVTQPSLPAEARRAREIEARGYRKRVSLPFGAFRVFMYAHETAAEVPPATVAAIRSAIEEMEPGWVAAVAEALRYADDPRIMAAWCEIPLQAVIACLEVLREQDGARERPGDATA